MQLGLTIPLERHLKLRSLPRADDTPRFFCWDMHIITLRGRPSLLAVNCSNRFAFALCDLSFVDWSKLDRVAVRGVRRSFAEAGVPQPDIDRYFAAAGPVTLTRTHGRREVAFLNLAWNDVLAHDFTVDEHTQHQPLLCHAVNALPCRCAAYIDTAPALEFLQRDFVQFSNWT